MCEDRVAAVERVGARRKACCGMGRRGIVLCVGLWWYCLSSSGVSRLMSLLSLFGGAEPPLAGKGRRSFEPDNRCTSSSCTPLNDLNTIGQHNLI